MRVLLISVISVFFFASCVSLNTNQTGRSLGANNNSLSTSISYGSTNDIDYGSVADNGKYYFGNIRYQRGMTNKFDIGVTINLSSFIITSLKYQVIGQENHFSHQALD